MIDLDLMREYLGIGPPSGDATDVLVEEVTRAAVAHVERKTGRYFGPVESVTEILRGKGTHRLYLTDLPHIAGDYSEPTVDTGKQGAASTPADLQPFDAFVLRTQGVEAWLARTDAGVWRRDTEYHVSYERGYEPDEEPPDIRRYVMAWVAREWKKRGREGMSSETIGGYTYQLARSDMTDAEMDDLLGPWGPRPGFA